jgi:hypothetical protein
MDQWKCCQIILLSDSPLPLELIQFGLNGGLQSTASNLRIGIEATMKSKRLYVAVASRNLDPGYAHRPGKGEFVNLDGPRIFRWLGSGSYANIPITRFRDLMQPIERSKLGDLHDRSIESSHSPSSPVAAMPDRSMTHRSL